MRNANATPARLRPRVDVSRAGPGRSHTARLTSTRGRRRAGVAFAFRISGPASISVRYALQADERRRTRNSSSSPAYIAVSYLTDKWGVPILALIRASAAKPAPAPISTDAGTE